uniref:Uncharacterized protein n=1 Tax=Picocystis salinarum TaxID=88271 RepID=A0A7S3XDE6_9CHLO
MYNLSLSVVCVVRRMVFRSDSSGQRLSLVSSFVASVRLHEKEVCVSHGSFIFQARRSPQVTLPRRSSFPFRAFPRFSRTFLQTSEHLCGLLLVSTVLTRRYVGFEAHLW